MKKSFIAILLLFSLQTLSGQSLIHEKLKWLEKPEIHEIDPVHNQEPAVIIADFRFIDYQVTPYVQTQYYTVHKIVKVNNDAGIEKFNKVYIPAGRGPLVDLKVRTISPDNQVQSFDQENLKELSNANGSGDFMIFAVEGVQTGGEIEYIYTLRQAVRSFGREVYQQEFPVLNASFELKAPNQLSFATKSYNGFPDSFGSFASHHKKIKVQNIPGLSEEQYSSFKSKLQRVDYKLVSTPNGVDLINWESISKNLFKTVQGNKGSAAARKFIKNLKLDGKTEAQKLMLIEKSIKESFTIEASGKDEYSDALFVFKNKVGNAVGMARVYTRLFEKLGVRFDVVFTSSRFLGSVDEDFPHSMDLRDILFYFPDYDKYISPKLAHMRFGPAPNVNEGNTALFIRTGYDYSTKGLRRVGQEVRTIHVSSADDNHLGTNAVVKLSPAKDALDIQLERFYQGHQAYLFRHLFGTSSPERLEDLQKDIVVSDIDDAAITDFRMENDDLALSADKNSYFRMHMKVTAKSLVQKAGNDYLVSIGKVIGKQAEMYEEKDRVTDIILFDTKQYKHQITLEVPEGYMVQGLEQLQIDNSVELDQKVVMHFQSDYTYEGNTLTITAKEEYEILSLDKSHYPQYQKVVNSAADFNKIVLVLAPKQ